MEKHPDDWLGIRSSDGALDVGQEVCLLELVSGFLSIKMTFYSVICLMSSGNAFEMLI